MPRSVPPPLPPLHPPLPLLSPAPAPFSVCGCRPSAPPQNVTLVCQAPATRACGLQQGYDLCVRTAMANLAEVETRWDDLLLASGQPDGDGDADDGDDDDGGTSTAVIVGAVVGSESGWAECHERPSVFFCGGGGVHAIAAAAGAAAINPM